ncbi:MAG: hypothetical protein ACE5IR_28690, partial [bacterium]
RGERQARKNDASVATSTVAAIRPHVEGKVSENLKELVTGGDGVWEQAADEYYPMMKAVARSLAPGYTTAAEERRRQIAAVKPDMRVKAAKTSGKKKGGKK